MPTDEELETIAKRIEDSNKALRKLIAEIKRRKAQKHVEHSVGVHD
jgi:hypothetical protein